MEFVLFIKKFMSPFYNQLDFIFENEFYRFKTETV